MHLCRSMCQLPDMVYLWIHIAMLHFIWELVPKRVPLQ